MKDASKKVLFPKMTANEKLLWAATYAVEYNRWTCGDERPLDAPRNQSYETKAARIALSQAAMAVLAARTAMKEMVTTSPNVVPMFAQQMVLAPKPKRKPRG